MSRRSRRSEEDLLHDFRAADVLHRSDGAVAFMDLGPLNAIAALVIATFKATIVVLFFMHVKYSTRLTWAVVLGSVFWLGIRSH